MYLHKSNYIGSRMGIVRIFHLCLFIEILLHLPKEIQSTNRSIEPEIQNKIEEFIQNVYLPSSNGTSLALAIVKNNGEPLYTTGFGLANQEKNTPITNDTQFLLASITKSMTTLVVVKLLHEKFPELGEAVLDTPIRKLIPEFNFTLIDRFRSEHATMRDLLAHRVCIYEDGFAYAAEAFNTTEENLFRQRYSEEICGFRSEFQYNNNMYGMAGYIAGVLANSSYEHLVQDLLSEIGMRNSALGTKSDDYSSLPLRARPYYVKENISYPMNTDLLKRLVIFNPDGGLYSTPNDMVQYMLLHLNNGKVRNKSIVPEEAMRWRTKPANHLPFGTFKTTDEDNFVQTFSYGLGLVLSSYDGWQYVFHEGIVPPFVSLMSLFPQQKLGIFTSTNQGSIGMDQVVLHTFIFETLKGAENSTEKAIKVWKQQKAWEEAIKISKYESLMNFLNATLSESFASGCNTSTIVGIYGSGTGGEVEVYEKFNDQTNTTGIYLSYRKWSRGWLIHVANTLYRILWDTDVVEDFYVRGQNPNDSYVTIQNSTLQFYPDTRSKFQLGVNLDTLPQVPWNPDSGSCKRDANTNL